jgi:predicted metalloprotease with PDZ domain
MRHLRIARGAVAFAVVAVALSGLALAGKHEKCSKSATECAAYMKEMYQTKGWAGLEKEANEDGTYKILSVMPNSPAEKAGVKAGDLLVSINGVTLSKENEAKLKEMHESGWKIGDTVSFGLKRGADISTVNVALERIPETVLASMIEKHSKEEHQVAKN